MEEILRAEQTTNNSRNDPGFGLFEAGCNELVLELLRLRGHVQEKMPHELKHSKSYPNERWLYL